MGRGRHSNLTTNNWLIPCFFFFDCILIAAVIVLWYFMQWREQTFTKHDASIPCSEIGYYSLPMREELIPDIIVYVLAFVLPPIVVLFGEAAVGLYHLQGGDKELFREKSVMTFGMKLHALLRRTVRFTGIFLLGAFITWILTRAGQLLLSRPAPDFFTQSTCPSVCTGNEAYYQISTCTAIVETARQSFPSLYSSLSAYASVFVTVYITVMMKLNSAHTLRPFVGLSCLSVPYLLGMQQIAFHKAHWIDVIAGWILGGAVAAYLIYGILDSFFGPLPSLPDTPVSEGEYDANEDYIISNGTAMRNGNGLHDKPMQMNGLRHSNRGGDRDVGMHGPGGQGGLRDTYMDRGMEMHR